MRTHLPRKYLLLLAVCVTTWSLSFSQVAPSTKGGNNGIYIFGEFGAGWPNYGGDYLLGPTVGGYMQFHRWLGGEVRGSVMHWGPSEYHQANALIGPRVQYPFHRLLPYGAFDIGIAHAAYPPVPHAPVSSANKLGWELATGVDYRLSHRIDLRLADFTYGKIYILQNGVDPKTISSGIVFRLF